MLRLVHVLFGVQPKSFRTLPHIPPAWQDCSFGEVVTDSREVEPGKLFLALSGERTDGHNYLLDVIARGAQGALVTAIAVEARRELLDQSSRPWALIDPETGAGLAEAAPDACLLIVVDDPLMAVQRLAVYHRRQLTTTVVGITGSVGKTSTKEVVAAVLSRRLSTLKSKRSFNSEATLPTTLLSLTSAHKVAVLEMGMWAPGEIRFLADLARPEIGLVTNVGPTHLERLGSIEAISRAKSELPEALPPTGWCVLNADDPRVAAMAEVTQAKVFTYGLSEAAQLRADNVESHGLAGISFRVHYQGQSRQITTPLIGKHSVYLALAAISIGLILNLEWDDILEGLKDAQAELRLFVVPGVHGSTLIDDTYNAAPISVLAALDLLGGVQGRRIAILGDMLELGSVEEEAHRSVGTRVAGVANQLITIGPRARWIVEAAIAAGMPADTIQSYESSTAVIQAAKALLTSGDTVLIKGSRGMEMEHIVAALQHRPQEEI